MASCKDCIHENVCVIKEFPDAFENTQWEKKPCDHFKSKTEWISVDDGVPEPNEECLVAAKVGDRIVIDLGKLIPYEVLSTGESGYEWMITNDWDEGEGCEITHWMPLPEPPKESKR